MNVSTFVSIAIDPILFKLAGFVFGVGVSCRNLYSFVVYLLVNSSGSITSVGEERANLSAVVYLLSCGFCLERFPLPLGAWDGLRYFIVALPEPSI